MDRKPRLVILAAGRGSRYGGLKQLEPVGPCNQAILDYTIHDARQGGFGSVVLVVSGESDGPLRAAAAERFGRHLPVDVVEQRIDDLPPDTHVLGDRAKPWGTGHAVWAARDLVDRPFGVVNADDLYGAGALAALGRFLSGVDVDSTDWAMVGYRLADTLPADGGSVSRALCLGDRQGHLTAIREIPEIARAGGGAEYVDSLGKTRRVDGEALVSMNIWGFTPAVFPLLERGIAAFLDRTGGAGGAEYYLSDEVDRWVGDGVARVHLLDGAGPWCGITNPEDRELVRERLARLTAEGAYPEELWP
jgi:NDP-sugar pyrophosphorylase family protein